MRLSHSINFESLQQLALIAIENGERAVHSADFFKNPRAVFFRNALELATLAEKFDAMKGRILYCQIGLRVLKASADGAEQGVLVNNIETRLSVLEGYRHPEAERIRDDFSQLLPRNLSCTSADSGAVLSTYSPQHQ